VTALGSDIHAVTDLDGAFRVVSGRLAHAQAIARRLGTPRGDLERIGDDPDYGTDLRAYVGADVGPRVVFEVQSAVEREALKDERTLSASAVATFAGDALMVALRLADADGPFSLTLAVSDVTVSVLKVS
jgi:phage baseplate assembly protein W